MDFNIGHSSNHQSGFAMERYNLGTSYFSYRRNGYQCNWHSPNFGGYGQQPNLVGRRDGGQSDHPRYGRAYDLLLRPAHLLYRSHLVGSSVGGIFRSTIRLVAKHTGHPILQPHHQVRPLLTKRCLVTFRTYPQPILFIGAWTWG